MSTVASIESIVLSRIAEIDSLTNADQALPPPDALEDRRAWEKIHAALKKLESRAPKDENVIVFPRYRTPRYDPS
jgi:hypothetical protein